MTKYKKLHLLVLTVLALSLLAGCSSKGTTLKGDDRNVVLTFSEAKTDNLFAGMNSGDYATFSKDFDKAMLGAMTKDQLDALKKDHDTRFGAYLSRQVNSVVKQGDFYAVIYDVKFEKDSAITVRVVFSTAEPHPISGLWFNK